MVQVSRPQTCRIISTSSGTILVVNKCSSFKAKGVLGNSMSRAPFPLDDMDKAALFWWGEKLRSRDASFSVTQLKMSWGRCSLLALLNRQASSSENSKPEHLSI